MDLFLSAFYSQIHDHRDQQEKGNNFSFSFVFVLLPSLRSTFVFYHFCVWWIFFSESYLFLLYFFVWWIFCFQIYFYYMTRLVGSRFFSQIWCSMYILFSYVLFFWLMFCCEIFQHLYKYNEGNNFSFSLFSFCTISSYLFFMRCWIAIFCLKASSSPPSRIRNR